MSKLKNNHGSAPRLLIVGPTQGAVHVKNFYFLVRDYFSEVLIVCNGEIDFCEHRVMEFSVKNRLRLFSNIKKLRAIIREFQPDIIHVQQANIPAFIATRANRGKIPMVLTCWGSDVLLLPKKNILMKKMVAYCLKKADMVTVDAGYMRDAVTELAGRQDTVLVNFGIEWDGVAIPPKEKIIYSNRLHKPLYRVDEIIEAFASFVQEHPGWKLVIGAIGEMTAELHELAAKRLPAGSYSFIGFVDAPTNRENYLRARIWVSVPESDGTSISLLEAMGYGCIPVVSNIPANREWIGDNRNGCIVSGNLSDAFSRALTLNLAEVQKMNASIIEQKATKEGNRRIFYSIYDQILSDVIKVCHITTAHPPFDGRIFHKECVSLVKAGYDVSLVATHSRSETIDGVRIVPLSPSKSRFYRFFVKTFRAFFKGLRVRAAVYHLHDPELLPVAIALKICGKKVIFDMHELVYHQIADKDYMGNRFARKLAAGVYKLAERTGMRWFDKIVLAEDGYRSYFEKNYPKRLNKLVFVRNYPIIGLIDKKLEKTAPQRTAAFTLVYAGSLTRIRGIFEICEAVRSAAHPVRLVLLGRWSESAYRDACGIDNEKIIYLGEYPLAEVYGVMRNANLGVSLLYPVENYLTSLPVKAFEYMACGLPMLMSDFPYWKEKFDGVAVFANPLSVNDIAKAINWCVENQQSLDQMGREAFQKVRAEFSWERESQQLINAYSRVLGNG